MKKTLLVIVPDLLSALVAKGEITARYYNPGDLFDEVHLLMTNSDRPDPGALQKTVGRARLHLHNLPPPSFPGTLGWQFIFLRGWVQAGIQLAREISPALIRVHGNFQNGYLAAQIKEHLGIPLVVSLHINPDVDLRGRTRWWPHWKRWLFYQRMLPFEEITLRAADWVLPVYEPIRSYAERRGAKHLQVCYNALNPQHLRPKDSYALQAPPRIISVGRQFEEKNPDNLIRALVRLPEARLTLVGDGPYHQHLQQVAMAAGVSARTDFLQAVPNDQLCRMLPEFDIFATHTEYWELSKAVLEALLTGLPVVLNRRRGEPVPELQGDFLLLVENTPEDYFQVLHKLLTDHEFREQLGRKAYAHAQENWAPAKTEAKFVEIYRQLTSIS
ncbi:MAG: glycosyltransferase family 4 protein [Deltaproteobacteria bacterium]|nr:glycosyltransferase family 4 protein [Deltaproteobacteria bacterium]